MTHQTVQKDPNNNNILFMKNRKKKNYFRLSNLNKFEETS